MPELRVRRDDLAACELADGEPPRDDVDGGEAQLRVERFATGALHPVSNSPYPWS